MLELKDTLTKGRIKEKKILTIRFLESRKSNRKVVRNSQKLREVNYMALYNPKFLQDLEAIKTTKEYLSAKYNLPFVFG